MSFSWSDYEEEIPKEQEKPVAKSELKYDDFWSDYEDQEPSTSNQSVPENRNLGQDIGLQTTLGLAKRFTFPLDILKSFATALGQQTLREEAREDPNLNMEVAQQAFEDISKYFPTQDAAEEFIKESTGVDLSPKTEIGKFFRKAGEFRGLTPGKFFEDRLKGERNKALGSLGGAATSKGLTAAGVSEPIADIVGLGAGAAASSAKLASKPLSAEAKELSQTAEKHNLPKYSGIEKEKSPLITPKVSGERQAKLEKELSQKTQQAVDKVIEGKLPFKKLKEEGVDLDEVIQNSYSKARRIAAKNRDKQVNIEPILSYIDKEIARIKNIAPSLSDQNEKVIRLLEKEKEALTTAKFNPETIINQHIENNAKVKNIYKKAEYSGAEDEIRQQVAKLNEKLIESAEKSVPGMAKQFKEANAAYSQKAKLDRAEELFKDADPKKLNSLLKNKKKRTFLERDLGKDAVKDLDALAKYGEQAHEKVFSKLKNPKSIQEWLTDTRTIGRIALKGILAGMGLKIPVALYEGGKFVATRMQGYLFTRPTTRRPYVDFVKAISTGNKPVIIKATKALEDSINQEFGSEKDLLDLASED